MTSYSASITKAPGLLRVPQSAAEKLHHVTGRDGELLKFKNPHPSYHGVSLSSLLSKLVL